MKKIRDAYVLDREDLIRMNLLVRGEIDLSGYYNWYDSICREEQIALILTLHSMAMQTGFYVQSWDRAARESGVSPKLSGQLNLRNDERAWGKLFAWLASASDDDRRAVLPLFVRLFGEAEAAVMDIETEETCNHWWHRDLRDPKVVADLRSNQSWSATSPKDDRSEGDK